MASDCVVRPASPEDLPLLAAIERAALPMFASTDLPDLADAPILDLAEVERYAAEGFVAVADHPRDGVVGFVVVRPLGGAAHVQEMDVRPEHGGRGLGRRLLEAAMEWSRAAGYASATLTTFRDVPWNAPFYERFGFREVPLEDAHPDLLELRRLEGTYGLPNDRRIIMKMDLGTRDRAAGPGAS
jgi:GNAT superfamily N-acetyltransferase